MRNAPKPPSENCLFLNDWEAQRNAVHILRRKRAEVDLCRLQLRVQNGGAALSAWLGVLESRIKLEDIAAKSSAATTDALDAHWKPLRMDACDGEAAAWLLASERVHASTLAAKSACWTAVVPDGVAKLKNQMQMLHERLFGEVGAAARAWDECHAAAEQAWCSHEERLHGAEIATTENNTPPDAWLSEVRYRERARAYIAQQTLVEQAIISTGDTLFRVETERAAIWKIFTASYTRADFICNPSSPTLAASETEVSQNCEMGLVSPMLHLPDDVGAGRVPAATLPEMPSAGGAVLRRTLVDMQAPPGLFGIGGGGWREGATLVLTLHGYLHLFFSCGPAKEIVAKTAAEGAEALSIGAHREDEKTNEELTESMIKASVYVPKATRCVFVRRGKELTLDIAEPEATEPTPAERTLSGGDDGVTPGRLRQWIGRATSTEIKPIPRRIQARLSDLAEFVALETHCHDFVRRGQARAPAV